MAMNTEPLYNRQVHIGRVAMYALGPKGEVTASNACEFDNAVSKKNLPGWSGTSLENRVQFVPFGRRSWSLFQPVHSEER